MEDKKFAVLFQVKNRIGVTRAFVRTRVFVSNLTKSFSQRMTSISRFLAKHRNNALKHVTQLTPRTIRTIFRERKNGRGIILVSFCFLFFSFIFFFLFQTIKTRIKYHKIVDLLQFGTIVVRVYRQTYINSFCLFVYRTVAFLGWYSHTYYIYTYIYIHTGSSIENVDRWCTRRAPAYHRPVATLWALLM